MVENRTMKSVQYFLCTNCRFCISIKTSIHAGIPMEAKEIVKGNAKLVSPDNNIKSQNNHRINAMKTNEVVIFFSR